MPSNPSKPLREQDRPRLYGGIVFSVVFLTVVVVMVVSFVSQVTLRPNPGPGGWFAVGLIVLALLFFLAVPLGNIVVCVRELRRRRRLDNSE